MCPDPNCNETYVGATARRLFERIKDHNGRDRKSHVIKHSIASKHKEVKKDDFIILNRNQGHYKKLKLSEALEIKRQKPSLNVQEKSAPLFLFNQYLIVL